jgi:hypothetical protein
VMRKLFDATGMPLGGGMQEAEAHGGEDPIEETPAEADRRRAREEHRGIPGLLAHDRTSTRCDSKSAGILVARPRRGLAAPEGATLQAASLCCRPKTVGLSPAPARSVLPSPRRTSGSIPGFSRFPRARGSPFRMWTRSTTTPSA